MDSPQYFTIASTLDDSDFDRIEIRVRRISSTPMSSIAIERAVLRWMASHFPAWTQHCIDTGMKTL